MPHRNCGLLLLLVVSRLPGHLLSPTAVGRGGGMVGLPSRLPRGTRAGLWRLWPARDVPVWRRRGVPSLARFSSNMTAMGLAAGTTLAIDVVPVTALRSAWAQQAQRFSLTVAP